MEGMSSDPPLDVKPTNNVAINRILHKQHQDMRDINITLSEGSITVTMHGKITPLAAGPDAPDYREDHEAQLWATVCKSEHLSLCKFATNDIVGCVTMGGTLAVILGTRGMSEDIARRMRLDGKLTDEEKN